MFQLDHKHLLVNAVIKNPILLETELNTWLSELVQLVDMKIVAGPTSIYVADEGNEGVTGTVTLATSHAAIHIWDHCNPPYLKFDLYSCKDFNTDIVIKHLNKMELQEYESIKLSRNGLLFKVIE